MGAAAAAGGGGLSLAALGVGGGSRYHEVEAVLVQVRVHLLGCTGQSYRRLWACTRGRVLVVTGYEDRLLEVVIVGMDGF